MWLSALIACSIVTSCLAGPAAAAPAAPAAPAAGPGAGPLLQPNSQHSKSPQAVYALTNELLSPGELLFTARRNQEPQRKRDYYYVAQGHASPPSAINEQIQGNTRYFTQETNSGAVALYGQDSPSASRPAVPAPVHYVIHHTPREPHTHTPQRVEQPAALNGNDLQSLRELQTSTPLHVVSDLTPRRSKPGKQADQIITPLIQVFTNHNCTGDKAGGNSEPQTSSRQAPAGLHVEIPSFDDLNIYSGYDSVFGAKVSSISSREKSSSDYKLARSKERQNSRSERVYISTAQPSEQHITKEGISQLVASTQDLVSNDDLLDINRAAEDETPPHNDDLISPKTKTTNITKLEPRNNNNYGNVHSPRNKITIKAKIGKIVNTPEYKYQDRNKNDQDKVFTSTQNQYNFATPIVVQGSTLSDFKTQIMDNIVSTIVPYLEDGYELANVKNGLGDMKDETQNGVNSPGSSVRVTPRPLSQKFLAPLTVGLRLLNSNNSEVFNDIEYGHKMSNSEVVSDEVEQPESERRGKTIVEVQKSIPIEFTEINDIVVYHDDSQEENMSKEELRSLHHQFNDALASSRKIQDDINQNLYRYGAQQVLIHPEGHRSKLEAEERAQEYQENKESMVFLESSHIQSEVELHDQGESQQNERKELIGAYNNHYGEKIVQPIIIEKEVPVTKFVDRFIEKKVPYPQPVEVIKEISVEKPYPYPVTVEKIVDRPVEVTRYVDRPRDVLVPHPVPIEVQVPYPVEKKVYVDRPVHFAFPIEKIVEKRIQVPVPTPVGIPVGVPVPFEQTVLYPIAVEKRVPVPYIVDRPVPIDRIVEKEVRVPYPVERRVPYPVHYETRFAVPYPVEKRVPYPVDRIIEKRVPFPVDRIVEKPVHVGVAVPVPVAQQVQVQVPVPQPYPVDRIVEKRVPYPVDRVVEKVVEKKVEVPVRVNVPYPVERIVEKIVTKYVDKPYPVEKRVPYPVPYEKIVDTRMPYPVEVKVPYQVNVPYPVEKYPVHVSFRPPYAVVERTPPSYEIPGPPYPQYSSPHTYAANVDTSTAFPPPPPGRPSAHSAQTVPQQRAPSTNNGYLDGQYPSVKTTQWGNLYASSYQYIKPKTSEDSFYKKTPNLDKYIGYLTNNLHYSSGAPTASQALPGRGGAPGPPRLLEWKLRRADRTPRVRIEYGGFRPPLVPSAEVGPDGLPVRSETTR